MSVLSLLSKLDELDIHIELVNDKLDIDAPRGKLTPSLLNQLKEKKEEIIEFFQNNIRTQTRYPSIKSSEKKEYYQLSSVQKRLYFLQQMDVKSTAYNMHQLVNPNEFDDKKRFTETFYKLIKRHESLRTSFEVVKDQPVQRVHNDVAFEIEFYEKADDHVIRNFIKPFDLSRAPLLHVGLIKKEITKYILIIDMHHIITDGTSQALLAQDFMSFYAGKELPPFRFQYKDYAEWLNSKEHQKLVRQQENYWLKTFSHESAVLNLPTDYPRPVIQSFAGASVYFVLQGDETRNFKDILNEGGATLYMFLLAAFNILLAKLSSQEDIIIGTPIAARWHPDIEHIVGMFVNTLAMRNYPSGDKTFKQFLKEVREHTLKAYENQDYPFEDLVDKILVRRDTSRNPLFDVMFNLMNQSEYPDDISAAAAPTEKSGQGYRNTTSKFDLNLTAVELEGGLFFNLEYCTKLFKENTIDRIIEYFKRIICSLSRDINQRLATIQIISDEENNRLLFEFNETKADFPGNKTVHRLFEKQAEKTPDNTALILGNHQLTYKELNKKANQLACLLRKKGIGANDIVALMTERTIRMVVGMIGIMKAGGAYLPIEIDYPEERQKYMLEDSSVKMLLINDDKEKKRSDIAGKIEMIDLGDISIYCSDSRNPGPINKPSDLGYVIYTSGSTGKPKGVLLEHRNLVNLLLYGFEYTNLDFSIVLQFASISFDVSFHEIFSTLLSGGKLCLITKEIITDIPELCKVIERNVIKTVFLPISLLKIIFNEENYRARFPRCLRHIQTAGEQVVISDSFRDYLQENNIYLHNHYGPSETHVVTALTLDPKGEIPSLPSIGKPVSNTGIYILDKYGNLQPIGIQGELYIGGIQVGNGYLNRPELTAEKFRRVVISHSSLVIGSFLKTDDCSHSPHSLYLSYHRLYRTGDLAKWALDGNIQFLGRIDHQVKIRGFRIEPGEIETHLLNHEAIRDALVLVKEKPGKEKYLCAYIVAENAEKKSEIQVLREYLSKKLPDYMIPAYFIYVDGIPLTPNRKVDRKALPEPEIEVSLEKYLAPRDETEEKIAAIWSELLEIKKEKIGIESNFFELGGNSLNLIRLVSKMYKEFGTEVPVTQIYNNPTIKKISKLLQSKKYTEVPVVLLNQSKEKKIFCFPPQLGYGILYQHLANIIRDYSWYAFNFIEDIEDEERLNKYANFITNFQPVGPYILLGYSAARRLTIQAAKYLENLNYEVSDIILLDCFFSENENLPTREQIKKYLKHYYRTLDDFLERSDAMFLKEKVKTKSLKYMKYNLYDKKRLEKVNANIHLILSEDAQNNEQLDKKSWDKLTKNRSLIYKGLGTHVGMIDPGTIEKNAEIIKEILQGIESKHSQNID